MWAWGWNRFGSGWVKFDLIRLDFVMLCYIGNGRLDKVRLG